MNWISIICTNTKFLTVITYMISYCCWLLFFILFVAYGFPFHCRFWMRNFIIHYFNVFCTRTYHIFMNIRFVKTCFMTSIRPKTQYPYEQVPLIPLWQHWIRIYANIIMRDHYMYTYVHCTTTTTTKTPRGIARL